MPYDSVSCTILGNGLTLYRGGHFWMTHSHRTESCEDAHCSQTQHARKLSVRSATISLSVKRYSYLDNKIFLTLGGTD